MQTRFSQGILGSRENYKFESLLPGQTDLKFQLFIQTNRSQSEIITLEMHKPKTLC